MAWLCAERTGRLQLVGGELEESKDQTAEPGFFFSLFGEQGDQPFPLPFLFPLFEIHGQRQMFKEVSPGTSYFCSPFLPFFRETTNVKCINKLSQVLPSLSKKMIKNEKNRSFSRR